MELSLIIDRHMYRSLEKEHCPTCNIRTWMITRDPITGTVKSDALTIPFEVYRGRCLLCHPLPPSSFAPTTANDSVPVAEVQAPPQNVQVAAAAGSAQQEGATSDREMEEYIVDARPETEEDQEKLAVVGEVVIGGNDDATTGPYQLQSVDGDNTDHKRKADETEELSSRHQHLREDESEPSRPSLSSAIEAEGSEEEYGDSNIANSGKRKRGGPNSNGTGRDVNIGSDGDDDGNDGDYDSDATDYRKLAAYSPEKNNPVGENHSKPTEEYTEASTTAGACKGKRKRKKRDGGPFVTDGNNDRGRKRHRSKGQTQASSQSKTSKTAKSQQKSGKAAIPSAQERKLKAAVVEISKEKKGKTAAVRSLKILLKQCKAAGSPEKEADVANQIVALGGVEPILENMKVLFGSSEVLLLGCEILQYVCYFDNAAVERHNVHRSIRVALAYKSRDVRVVQSSIAALQTCVGVTKDIDREIISGGCLDQVVKSMEEHANVPEIQLNACLFLQDLTAEADPASITNVLRSGALDSVIRAIKHTKKSDIILAGLAAIGNMPQEELVDSDASLQTFESLKSFLHTSMDPIKGDPVVVAQCCGLLNNLSVETSRINVAAVEAGFIRKTTGVLEAFDDDENVQSSGCMLLRALAHGHKAGRSDEIVRDGGLERISYCLSAFIDNVTVLAAALGALRNINHPEDHSCSIVDTVDKIFRAMENHPEEQEIQEDCCELLWQYMAFSSVLGKIKEEEALLTDAADNFPQSCGPIVAIILPMLYSKDNSFSV